MLQTVASGWSKELWAAYSTNGLYSSSFFASRQLWRFDMYWLVL